jgi:hypothetical protein
MRDDPARKRKRHLVGAAGLVLLVLGQTLTLVHLRPWSDYWYGLVWSGFVLFADAIVDARSGGSLVLDRPRELAAMFVVSACAWWSFEIVNVALFSSWSYSASPDVPLGVQVLRSSFFFGTLVPATWQASALALSFARVGPRSGVPSRPIAAVAIACGIACLVMAIAWRALALPFALIGTGLFVDAVNMLRRRPSLLALLRGGAFPPVVAIMLGNVLAGVLGEMWNFPADPRWTYEAPYAGDYKLFAMPLPGYAGYAALALVLFALYHSVRPRIGGRALPEHHPLTILGTGA